MINKILWAVLTAFITYLSMVATGPILGLFIGLGFSALALDMCDNDADPDGKNY